MKKSNQQIIKNNHLKHIYNLIQEEPNISRASLAKITKLSKTTISSLTDELIERKFILDTGTLYDTTAIGRKPNGLQLRQGEYCVIVFSWHFNRVTVRIIDICGTIITHAVKHLSDGDTYTGISRHLLDNILNDIQLSEKILGVCFVVPAMLDKKNEAIISTVLNTNAYGSDDLAVQIRNSFQDFPIAILNDTACAAYAEKIYSKIPQNDFAYINFQHGIGAALFIHNKLLGDATASYTQFGHCSIDANGKLCSCGNRGCLELMISEDTLKERLINANCLSTLVQSDSITYADLGSAALYGDSAAQKVVCDIAHDFSIALNNLVCLVNPKAIIIGGKGKALGPLFLNEIAANLNHSGFHQMVDSVELIRYSSLDSVAYFIGAMKYFFDIHYDFSQDMTNTLFIG